MKNFLLLSRAVFLISLLAMGACAPSIATRGNRLDPDRIALIKVGESTREDVLSKMGTPTQVGMFDENIWYYFGRRTEQYSFFTPEVVEQKTVEIRFNDEGIVTAMSDIDPAAAKEINPIARRTPTYGHETTIVEQLLGNIGAGGVRGKAK